MKWIYKLCLANDKYNTNTFYLKEMIASKMNRQNCPELTAHQNYDLFWVDTRCRALDVIILIIITHIYIINYNKYSHEYIIHTYILL